MFRVTGTPQEKDSPETKTFDTVDEVVAWCLGKTNVTIECVPAEESAG